MRSCHLEAKAKTEWWIWVDVKATQIWRSVFGKRRAESEFFPSRAAPHVVTFLTGRAALTLSRCRTKRSTGRWENMPKRRIISYFRFFWSQSSAHP